jgi:predicted secreted hydrolase
MQTQSRLDGLDDDTKANVADALWLPAFSSEGIPDAARASLAGDKNSNRAFGERQRYRLQYMKDHPDSHTPSYQERYARLIEHCDSLSPHQAYVIGDFLGQDKSKGYQRVPEHAGAGFPRTHAAALGSQFGWYYLIGNCTAVDGTEYGVLYMLFRSSLLPLPVARHYGLSDVENQVVELQLAITRAGDRGYQAAPTVLAGTTGLVQFEQGGFGASLGRNAMRSTTPGNLFPMQAQAHGWDRGTTPATELGIDLTFASGKAPLIQGIDGCLPCCAGIGTLYYSVPNIRLDPAVSTISLGGETIQLAEGTFWLDHQWGVLGNPRSSVMRAAGELPASAGPGGWDWFAAQFDGDRQITVVAFHTADNAHFYGQTGPNPPGTMQVAVQGKYFDEQSRETTIHGTLTVPAWLRSVVSPDPALYEPTQVWYPDRWQFQFGPEVPAEIRSFTMEPIVDSGSSLFFARCAPYAEAPVRITNAAGERVGRGFAESVEYANPIRNKLRLTGLPATDAMVALVAEARPTALERAWSLLSVLWPPHHAELKRLLAGCGTV